MQMCSFKVGKTDLEDSLDIFEDIYQINNGKIKYICTDGNPTYSSHMSYFGVHCNTKHFITKTETCLVESWNSRLRYYIPALVRKTKCYFKSLRTVQMAMDFFMLVHNYN
jgi:IS1 family transposase